jgi:hypothetical protein
MHQTVKYRLEMMLGVDRWSGEPGLPANALATTLFAANKAVIAEMIAAAAAQAVGRGRFLGANAERMRVATQLRGVIRKVGMIAKVLDPAVFPEIAQQARAPRSASYQALVASAGAIKRAVAPAAIKEAFVARGMAADFDVKLGELMEALQGATGRKAGGRGMQVGGTAGLLAYSRRGLAIVRELNAIMTVLLEDDPARLAQWKSVSRVQRGAKRSASEDGAAVVANSPGEPGATVPASSPLELGGGAPVVADAPASSSSESRSLVSSGSDLRTELIRFANEFKSAPDAVRLPETVVYAPAGRAGSGRSTACPVHGNGNGAGEGRDQRALPLGPAGS